MLSLLRRDRKQYVKRQRWPGTPSLEEHRLMVGPHELKRHNRVPVKNRNRASAAARCVLLVMETSCGVEAVVAVRSRGVVILVPPAWGYRMDDPRRWTPQHEPTSCRCRWSRWSGTKDPESAQTAVQGWRTDEEQGGHRRPERAACERRRKVVAMNFVPGNLRGVQMNRKRLCDVAVTGAGCW